MNHARVRPDEIAEHRPRGLPAPTSSCLDEFSRISARGCSPGRGGRVCSETSRPRSRDGSRGAIGPGRQDQAHAPGTRLQLRAADHRGRGRYYGARLVYGLVLLYFVGQYADWRGEPSKTIQQMAMLGRRLFTSFIVTQAVAVLLLTPALVAGVIADEKQRKTLHYLLASPLTSGEIVLGKLLARLLHLGVLVAVGLPVVSLLSLFGGVDPRLVLLGFAATLTTAYFVAGLSILVSTISRRPREAISQSYVLMAFWLFVPPLLGTITTWGGPIAMRIYGWIRPVNEWVAPTSPLYWLFSARPWVRPGAVVESFAWMMGLQLAYGTALIALAVTQLRPSYRRADTTPRWATRLAVVRRAGESSPVPSAATTRCSGRSGTSRAPAW